MRRADLAAVEAVLESTVVWRGLPAGAVCHDRDEVLDMLRADELRELQRRAVQSVENSGQSGAPAVRSAFAEQSAGLAKRDYVPLAVAIFVDLCLLLVSIGRPVNQFVGLQRGMSEAEKGPVYPILARFHDIHADGQAIRHFEVFRDVIFDFNGHYHVAVPLNIPKGADNYEDLQREAHRLGNLCYALEGKGILSRPIPVDELFPPNTRALMA